jgi:O-antigen/teichoic acid export membrane protein
MGQERLMLFYFHGTYALGLYGLSIIAMSVFEAIASNFFTGILPFLTERVVKDTSENSKIYALKILSYLSEGITLLIILSATFIGILTKVFLQKYEAGLIAAFISLSSMLFMHYRWLPVYFKASSGDLFNTFGVYMTVLSIMTIPNMIIISKFGIIGAAIAQMLTQFALAFMLMKKVFAFHLYDIIGVMKRQFIVLPFILLLGWVNSYNSLLTIAIGLIIGMTTYLTSTVDFKQTVIKFIKKSP